MGRGRRSHDPVIPMGATPETTPLAVRRVETDHGSHVEPPMDQAWSELDKLRWHAGVLQYDHGVTINVSETRHGQFALHGSLVAGGGIHRGARR